MDQFQAIFEKAKTYCRTADDLAHLNEATECAKWICEREGGNAAVVIPAIMLHDIGWSQFSAEEEAEARGASITARAVHHRHEEEGSRLARIILQELDYDPLLINEITEIIRWHDSRPFAQSHNDAIVKDGNCLSRYTPTGIKCAASHLHISEAELEKGLQDSIDRNFLTKTARLAARLYLCKRRLRSLQTTKGGLIDRLLEIFLELADRVLSKAQKSLEEIAIEGLRQRLFDFSRQLEIYIQGHPGCTIPQLQADPEFQTLAVQRIFTDGYTGIIDIRHDSPSFGQVIFHPDPRMVNQPTEVLQKERPSNIVHSFWDWYGRALKGEEFFSYYRSKDTADTAREKVQYVAPLRVGNIEWSLVVSAYADHSFHHANALAAEISKSIDIMLDELDTNMLLPLSRLIAESEIVSAGNFSHRVQIDTDNELALLGAAFNKMVQSVQNSNLQMQESAKQLEKQRDELIHSLRLIEEQQASIAQLSVPVIRIWEHVLVLPLVGGIDEARGRRITEIILQRVVEERAHHVFIDLTGVSLAGPEIIDILVKIAQAIRLLGAACTMTGINSNIARTLAHSDHELRSIRTEMNLEQGLRRVLAI